MTDFDKSTRQGLIFFTIDFEFERCEPLSSPYLKKKKPAQSGGSPLPGLKEGLPVTRHWPSAVAEEGFPPPPAGLVRALTLAR